MNFWGENFDFKGWKLWISGVKTMILMGENYEFLWGENYDEYGWKLWISGVKTMIFRCDKFLFKFLLSFPYYSS